MGLEAEIGCIDDPVAIAQMGIFALALLAVISEMMGLGVAFAAVPFLSLFLSDLVHQVQPLTLILNGLPAPEQLGVERAKDGQLMAFIEIGQDYCATCYADDTQMATICTRDAIEFPATGYIRQLIRDEKLLRQSKDMLKANREKYDVAQREPAA